MGPDRVIFRSDKTGVKVLQSRQIWYQNFGHLMGYKLYFDHFSPKNMENAFYIINISYLGTEFKCKVFGFCITPRAITRGARSITRGARSNPDKLGIVGKLIDCTTKCLTSILVGCSGSGKPWIKKSPMGGTSFQPMPDRMAPKSDRSDHLKKL